MPHVRVGDLIVKMSDLMSAQRNAPRRGGLRLRIRRGPVVDMSGPDAARLWGELCRLVPESPDQGEPKSAGGHAVPRRAPAGE